MSSSNRTGAATGGSDTAQAARTLAEYVLGYREGVRRSDSETPWPVLKVALGVLFPGREFHIEPLEGVWQEELCDSDGNPLPASLSE
jgi:hypothetical protein